VRSDWLAVEGRTSAVPEQFSGVGDTFALHYPSNSRGGPVKFGARWQREIRRAELKPETIAVEAWEHVQMGMKNFLTCRFAIGQE